jgi:hypothetical protein
MYAMAETEQKQRALEVFNAFRQAMYKHGRPIALPKNTALEKTYTWRYINRFLSKLDDMEVPERATSYVVNAVVHRAKQRHQLHRGIAVLDDPDVLDACSTKLEREVQSEDDEITNIERSHSFVVSRLDGKTLFEQLAHRTARDAYANIVSWHQAGYITTGFIAVSKACMKSFSKLREHELAFFPSKRELLKVRVMLLYNDSVRSRLSSIIGNDLLEER